MFLKYKSFDINKLKSFNFAILIMQFYIVIKVRHRMSFFQAIKMFIYYEYNSIITFFF